MTLLGGPNSSALQDPLTWSCDTYKLLNWCSFKTQAETDGRCHQKRKRPMVPLPASSYLCSRKNVFPALLLKMP